MTHLKLNIIRSRRIAWFILYLIVLLLVFSPSVGHSQKITKESYNAWVAHPNTLATLDSLIHGAERLALNSNDYNHAVLDGILTGRIHLNSLVDTLRTDSLIHRLALHFFSDLAYGNHAPALQNDGLEFKLNSMHVPELLLKHHSSQGLVQLVHLFTSMSKEVTTLLTSLHQYQDSSHKNAFRIRQLFKAVNDYRWLRAVSEKQKVILVNIPSAQLKVFEREKIILSMKLVLGKESTPTNSFSTVIKQITINPYWNVPKSIATKEMLPKLKTDNDYLERNHLQVLNANYRLIKAEGIDWNSYSENNFPFYLRQSTGCDNSLGIIKLEFDSPYGIYLHDTPEKTLFNYTNRFYSHGCMRMEKPIDMAKLLMKENRAALDTINLETCYKNPNPITIPIPIITPLVVWYSLIDFDTQGSVKFYKDVYHRLTY